MSKYRILIERVLKSDKEIVGNYYFLGENDNVIWKCNTLELAYRDNKNNISSIPIGKYKVRQRSSAKYNKHIHIFNVPNRKYILIHNANFYKQLRGCIAVGSDLIDIDGDGEFDTTSSVKTLKELVGIYEKYADSEELELEIVNAF